MAGCGLRLDFNMTARTESGPVIQARIVLALLVLLAVPLLETLSGRASLELRSHLDRRGELETYIQSFRQVTGQLDALRGILPDYRQSLALLDDLMMIGQECRVKVQNIRSRRDHSRGEVRFLYLDVPVSGSYRQVKDFILRVERSERPVTIESVENNPHTGNDGELSLVLGLAAAYAGDDHAGN